MRTASSTASCAAGVWANAAVVTSKRVNRVRIAVLDARGTDLVAGPRGSAPLNLSCKHPIHSGEVAGTLRAYRRQTRSDSVPYRLPVIRKQGGHRYGKSEPGRIQNQTFWNCVVH